MDLEVIMMDFYPKSYKLTYIVNMFKQKGMGETLLPFFFFKMLKSICKFSKSNLKDFASPGGEAHRDGEQQREDEG